MSNSDKQVCGALAVIILIYVAVLTSGLLTSRYVVIVYLNLTTSVSLLVYWTQKQFRIRQHIFELREFIVLGFEALVAGSAVYALIAAPARTLHVAQISVLVVHLIAFLAFFLFMLAFRMKKLF